MSLSLLRTTHPHPGLGPAFLKRALLRRQSPFPLDPEHVVFFYQGHAGTRSVELAGELTGWHSKHLSFQRGPQHLFYLIAKLPADTRLEYKFIVDGDWTLDPWNQTEVINGLGGTNSAFAMAGYQLDPHQNIPDTVPQGRLDSLVLEGKAIAGQRHLYTYLPPGFESTRTYPVLYLHDGGDYMHRARLPRLLDHLIDQGLIQPLIAVGIDPIHRYQEYTCSEAYAELLINEVLPLIEARLPVRRDAAGRGLCGSSLGGLTSAWLGHRHSDVFGLILSQSGSFPYGSERMRTAFSGTPRLPLRLWLSAGRYEGLLKANRNLVQVLSEKGYDYEYREYQEGHNWTHWSHRLSQGLTHLFRA